MCFENRERNNTQRRNHLLGRNFKGLTPHINFLVDINTGDDEENTRPTEKFDQS